MKTCRTCNQTKPAACPIGGEPCQSMCDAPCGASPKPHDPNHPYVRRLVGCGHGVLFKDHCRDCEIVSLREQYRTAVQTVMRVRNRLRALGETLPGNVAP